MEKQAGDDQQHIASGGASLVAGLSSDIMGGIACATGRGASGRSGSVVSDSGVTSTPPRQSSKRDSGYHTDCSPATFSPLTPQFTFDTSGEVPGERPPYSPGPAFPGPSLSPGGPNKSRLPGDSGDEDENRTEHVVTTASKPTGVPDIKLFQAKVDLGTVATRRKTTASSLLSEDDADDKCDIRCVGAAARLGSVQEEKEEREEVSVYKVSETESVYNSGETESQGTGSFMGAPGAAAQRRCRLVPRSDFGHGGDSSPARSDIKPDDDNDDDVFGDDEKGTGVACTAYHHAALSAIRLPGGDRFRPLLARSIATQTPHVHCQLIDQILACPQPLPACARGSAVRRLRYYSEGEETASVSVLTQGPLPDLVPITYSQFALRERSLSAPDLESQQRQRLTEREVGRELRRISDEFLRTHAFRHVRPGALASIHAELNTVAALFLGGARRLLYRNFAGYFRCVFTWTRRAVLDAERHEADSPVDSPR